jgi:hypothetical protein
MQSWLIVSHALKRRLIAIQTLLVQLKCQYNGGRPVNDQIAIKQLEGYLSHLRSLKGINLTKSEQLWGRWSRWGGRSLLRG